MSRHRSLQLIAGVGVMLVLAFGVALFMAEPSDAQPQFREFSPPNNPVDPSVNHRFEFPGNVQAETRFDQRGRSTPYTGYVQIFDDSETVSMMIPAQWTDVDLDYPVAGDPSSGVRITASSDLIGYEEGVASGVTLVAVPTGSSAATDMASLDGPSNTARDRCGATRVERQAYQDPFFSGNYNVYGGCTNGASQIVLSATTGTGDATVFIQALITSNADMDAVRTIFDSFQVLGTPGIDEDHADDGDADHEH